MVDLDVKHILKQTNHVLCDESTCTFHCYLFVFGPVHEILVLFGVASSEGSDKPVHSHSVTTVFTSRMQKSSNIEHVNLQQNPGL